MSLQAKEPCFEPKVNDIVIDVMRKGGGADRGVALQGCGADDAVAEPEPHQWRSPG